DEAERALVGGFGQVHRDAFPDEEGPLRPIVAGVTQHRVERPRVEVGRYEDDAIGDRAEDLHDALALGRYRRGKIQLEESHRRKPLAEAIGAAVEPGPEVDHLGGTLSERLDQ